MVGDGSDSKQAGDAVDMCGVVQPPIQWLLDHDDTDTSSLQKHQDNSLHWVI